MQFKNKLKDAIFGFAIADATGVPYEFKPRGNFKATDMVGYGTYNLVEGTWSDDTSMTIVTCHSIKEKGFVDLKDLMEKFSNWFYKGEYTPFGEVFDIGITTRKAIFNYNNGKSIDKCGLIGEFDNGNGSLMRILPLAFTDCDTNIIDKVSSLTHAHEISKEACRIYVKIARDLLNGIELKDSLKNIETGKTYERLKYLEKLSENEIKSTGYVVDTIEASLWCVLQTDNYKDCVLKAVNLGNDTDTVAAIAGGLAGIIYGLDNIPNEWITKLKNKQLIENCLF
ncbi:MAG: ADP-ribosylglycohydrolase [Christensenellaceae bacterium]|nr:ADP-ribosylglycohydrolase [Christensenellaceae bacterium]